MITSIKYLILILFINYFYLFFHNFDFIYDDKDDNLSEKFRKWDLYGVPYQVIIGKQYKNKGLIEVKSRKTGKAVLMTIDDFIKNIK